MFSQDLDLLKSLISYLFIQCFANEAFHCVISSIR